MTKLERPQIPQRSIGDNAPQPIRTLRDWLDHLAAREHLLGAGAGGMT